MQILLIQPTIKLYSNYLDNLTSRFFPNPQITLQQLATITPEKYSVKLLDEAYQQINFNEKYDLIGVTCCTSSAPRAYEIADEFKRKGNKVVIGGYHPSALPQEAKQHADSVVIGEAENSWNLLLNDLEKNQLRPFYHSKKPVDLNNLPPLKRSIGELYSPIARIEATRGCPYNCDYCSISNSKIGWNIFRKKPIENVIKEIQSIPQKNLIFCDTSFTVDVEYTKLLFKELKSLDKKFMCYGNTHILNKDDNLLELAREAGCYIWNIGFESISQEALDSVGKNTNRVDEYFSVVKKIKDHGMGIIGQFMFGFDTDTVDIFDETIDMVNTLDIDIPSFNILTPFPGTPLFERLNREGRILTKDWSKYTLFNVVHQPKNMSPQELWEGFNKIVTTFYNVPNLFKRSIRSLNLSFYNSIGVIYRNFFDKAAYKKLLKNRIAIH